MHTRLFLAGVVAAVVLLGAAYSNHFGNSFHFDDFHTVTDNVHIRTLANVPRFFTDVATFSVLPTHQLYRPVVTTSLAIDYWLGGGLTPLAFHATTFFWFFVLLVCVYALFLSALDGQRSLALFGAALYGLHPVMPETVNYIIQRGDLYSTLGVVAALVVYIRWPQQRRLGLYLIPFVLGALSKPPALVFPALLLLYECMRGKRVLDALRVTVPALVATIALALLLSRMIAPTFNPGASDKAAYWWSQPWITFEYVSMFFWPNQLSADRGAALLHGFPPQLWAGIVFCVGLVALTAWFWRKPEWRVAGYGLAWFIITLLPTALMPLGEASNDHRMFFPFIGLILTMCAIVRHFLASARPSRVYATAAAGCLVLLLSATGTYARNQVWRTEETLWQDVTIKNPENGRGWMNYGLTLMARGDFAGAQGCFVRARSLDSTYPLVAVNLGIALAGLGRHAEAEAEFRRAEALDPRLAATHSYFARWLLERTRYADAIAEYEQALAINPVDLLSYHGLMRAQFDQQNWSALRPLVNRVRELDPNDADANGYLAKLNDLERDQTRQKNAVTAAPTPEGYLDLSLLAYRAGRFGDCIADAKKALSLRPNYAEAYINIAACHNALGEWEPGIAAAQQAVQLNPSSQLARNNLAWAISQRNKPAPVQGSGGR